MEAKMRLFAILVAATAFLSAAGAADLGDGDDSLSNSLGMKMIGIAPGTFAMGCADGPWDERPVHEVTLTRPLRISATEVTNAQYEQFGPRHRELRGKLGFSSADDEAANAWRSCGCGRGRSSSARSAAKCDFATPAAASESARGCSPPCRPTKASPGRSSG